MEPGELLSDEQLVGGIVGDVCHRNAVEFLRLPGLGVGTGAAHGGAGSRGQ